MNKSSVNILVQIYVYKYLHRWSLRCRIVESKTCVHFKSLILPNCFPKNLFHFILQENNSNQHTFFFLKQTPMPSMSRKIVKQVGIRQWQTGDHVRHSKKWLLLNSSLLLMPSRESLPNVKLSDFSKVKNIDF